MAIRWTEEKVRKWLKQNRPNIRLVSYCGTVKGESVFYCKTCKTELRKSFDCMKDKRSRGTGCFKCGHRGGAEKLSITEEQVKEWLKIYRPDIELVEYGGGSSKRSKFRCMKCGNEWNITFRCVKRGNGCPKCAGNARVTEEQAREWLEKYRPNIELVEYGGGSSKRSKFHCIKCGCEWCARFDSIKNKGTGCPDCICKYKKDGVTYDSRGEFVWFLYQELCGCVWHRNEQGEDKGYYVLYRDENNKLRQFHPDFYIINPRFKKIRCYKDGVVCYVRIKMVEIKPDKGGWDKHHTIKRKVAKKYGIDFIGNDVLSVAEVVLYDNGITGGVIEQYRLNKKELEEYVMCWFRDNRPNIELVEYGGYNWRVKSKFRCTKCGYAWNAVCGSVMSGRGCPKCAKVARVTEEQAREWLKKHRPNIELVKYGGGVHKESMFRCLVCKNVWRSKYGNIRFGRGCPICGRRSVAEKKRIKEEQIRDWLNNNKPNIELLEYSGCVRDKSKLRCKLCGNEWSAVLASVKYKNGCPKCGIRSRAEKRRITEKQVQMWLKENRPEIDLVSYVGHTMKKSVFKCEKCNNVWEATFSNIKQGKGCPNYRLHKQKELANGKA